MLAHHPSVDRREGTGRGTAADRLWLYGNGPGGLIKTPTGCRSDRKRTPISGATAHKITDELARMRQWRRAGDERELERCNDRINNLLDQMVASATPMTVVEPGEVNALNVD